MTKLTDAQLNAAFNMKPEEIIKYFNDKGVISDGRSPVSESRKSGSEAEAMTGLSAKEFQDAQLNAAFNMKSEKIIKYFNDKGLKTSYNWHEVYADAHAKAFTIAKMTELDLLKDTKNLLEKSLEHGQSYGSFKSEALNLFSQKGWIGYKEVINPKTGEKETVELGTPRRIKNIFDSNINSAYAAGRYKEQLEEIDIAPYWQYMTVADERTRPEHAALHGKVFRADDPFWQNFYPPNGWGCRCFVRNLTKHELEKSGLKVEKTDGGQDGQFLTVNKKIGGEIKQIPAFKFNDGGITRTLIPDAGWETNIGKSAWGIDVQAWNKVKDMDEKIKYKFISKMAENPHNKEAFSYFIDRVVKDGFKTGREDKTVTWLSAEVFSALESEKTSPVSPIVVYRDNEVGHVIGNREKMTAGQLKKAYDVLNDPDAVYFDYTQKDVRLAFVQDIPDSDNCMKVCVKFDQKIERAIKENGVREKTSKIINTVSTVGIVRKTNMNDTSHYKKIYIKKE